MLYETDGNSIALCWCSCRTVVLRKDSLDEREADFYEALYTQSQAQFGAYVSAGTVVNNYAHIFDLLIRLRQAVDHPVRSDVVSWVIYSRLFTHVLPSSQDLLLQGALNVFHYAYLVCCRTITCWTCNLLLESWPAGIHGTEI